MSDCCSTTPNGACSIAPGKTNICPACGAKGQAVQVLTVKSLVREHNRVSPAASYMFCRTPDCDVVYFSADAIFRKPDVKVRVGLKENEDPMPLCYCFDYTREDVRRDLAEQGRTEIPERIKAEIKAGFCACEVKNPSGNCCLGNIIKVVYDLSKEEGPVERTAPSVTRHRGRRRPYPLAAG